MLDLNFNLPIPPLDFLRYYTIYVGPKRFFKIERNKISLFDGTQLRIYPNMEGLLGVFSDTDAYKIISIIDEVNRNAEVA